MIPLEDVISSIRREIAMRRNVYPRQIRDGRMTEAKAEHEIACMVRALEILATHLDPPQAAELVRRRRRS